MDARRPRAALHLVRTDDTDCPVCGLGAAFTFARQYDVCARCGWVDDPDAYANPERRAETNEESLRRARATWPQRLVRRLAEQPRSTLEIAMRDDRIGGYDFVVDGVSLRELFPAARGLRAAIGPWPADRDWSAALRSGEVETPTGRCRLYVCPLCGGDDYEPQVTADVEVRSDAVIWSRIGLESYDYDLEGWELDLRRRPAGFAFDAAAYRRAFANR
jgi:hypothetical protein